MYKIWSKLIIILTLIITVILFWFSTGLKFDYNFENFFPKDNSELNQFNAYRTKFEPDNDFLLLGIVNRAGIFDSTFLFKVNLLTDSINKLPLIKSVISPTNVKNTIIGGLGPIQVPYLHYDSPEQYKDDSLTIFNNSELTGTVFSKGSNSISLFIRTVDEPSKVKSDSIVNMLENLTASFKFDEHHLSGKVKLQKVYIEKMQGDLLIFASTSFLLVTLILAFTFRTISGVLIPLVIIILSVVWIFGFMGLTGKSIDLMITLVPTIMFVVGMSDVIHIFSKYIEEIRNGKEKIEALKITMKEIGLATFLTSLTTAIGFLTLVSADIIPVQEFGIYMAIGVVFAYVLAFTFFPAILLLLPIPKISKDINLKVRWDAFLAFLFSFILKNTKNIGLVSLLLLLVSVYFAGSVKINNFLLEDLSESHPVKQDFKFFETNFSGVRPFEMLIEVKDKSASVLDYEVMKDLEKLDLYLKSDYQAGFLISPLTLVKSFNKAYHGGNQESYRLPDSQQEYDFIITKIKAQKKQKFFKTIIASDERSARFSGKISDIGSYRLNSMNDSLMQFITSRLDSKKLDFKITGSAHLIDLNNKYLAYNMLQGLLISFIIIALIVGLQYKSLKMIIIALIPNILPLIIIIGILGISGIDLKISTSITFTIAFGIAVDDTIHFISKLKLELAKGKSVLYAVKRTFMSTGKAIILTSVILCGGFITLIGSDFTSTFYVGLLISLTLFIALLADLFLLPVLIIWFYKR